MFYSTSTCSKSHPRCIYVLPNPSYTLSNPFPSVHALSQHTSVFTPFQTHLSAHTLPDTPQSVHILPNTPQCPHPSQHTTVFPPFPTNLSVPSQQCVHSLPKFTSVFITFPIHLTLCVLTLFPQISQCPYPSQHTSQCPYPSQTPHSFHTLPKHLSVIIYSYQHNSVFTPSQQTSVFTPFPIHLGVHNHSNSPYCVCIHLVPIHPTVFIPFQTHLTVFIPFPTHHEVFIPFPTLFGHLYLLYVSSFFIINYFVLI